MIGCKVFWNAIICISCPPPPPFYAPPWDHNKVTLNTAQSLQELEGGGGVGEGGGQPIHT